jgi:hypothetical protein
MGVALGTQPRRVKPAGIRGRRRGTRARRGRCGARHGGQRQRRRDQRQRHAQLSSVSTVQARGGTAYDSDVRSGIVGELDGDIGPVFGGVEQVGPGGCSPGPTGR